MSVRPVGIINAVGTAVVVAQNVISLNPVNAVDQCTEFGISMNDGPDSVQEAGNFSIRRLSADGSGGAAATIVPMQDDLAAGLTSTGRVNDTTLGTTADILHRLYVPVVSGVIWVAAPGREFDVKAAEFLVIRNEASLPAGVDLNAYLVWEE